MKQQWPQHFFTLPKIWIKHLQITPWHKYPIVGDTTFAMLRSMYYRQSIYIKYKTEENLQRLISEI